MKTLTITDSEDHITPKAIEESATSIIAQNSVLVVVRSGILSHTLPVSVSRVPVTLNQDLKACTPVDGVDSDYLAWALRAFSQDILHKCQKDGTTVASIESEALKRYNAPIAPSAEQRRIVAKLEELFSELDAGVAALRRSQRRLARYRQALLKAAVTGELTREWREGHTISRSRPSEGPLKQDCWPGTHPIPDEWCWSTLGEVAKVKGGVAKGGQRTQGSEVRAVPYLRVANVQRGHLDLTEVKEIEVPESVIQDLCLKPGDVLFNEGGDRDKLGRGWIWSGEIPECIHQNHVFRARVDLGLVEPKWLSHFGNSAAQAYFESQGKQTTNLASISLSKLKALPVPLPSIAEQRTILAELDRRLSAAEALEATFQASLRRAERLRQSILEHAFRGELVPQDPHDEPAEALLARLKATAPGTPTPRRRGRPPKVEPADPPLHRRRGRPRKQVSV